MTARKQVLLFHPYTWADVTAEDDEWICATNPIDGVNTMVDRRYEHYTRAVEGSESDGEAL
jgi:hypothetical protein